MKNKHLFWIWGGLFILCALLGFIPQPEGFLKGLLILVSIAFFFSASLNPLNIPYKRIRKIHILE